MPALADAVLEPCAEPVRRRPGRACLLAVVLACGGSLAAHAEEHRRATQPPPLPAYVQECAACHVAYASWLLPATSWQRLMGGLKSHFGTDASLDKKTTAQLSTWLTENAATNRRVLEEPPQDRISLSSWFVRQHREVSAAVWKRPAIKSASNCSACHPGAASGDFNEHRVQIPR
jgi:hypothetical protein